MPRLCHVVLLALVLCPAEAFSVAGLPDEIDKTSGRISFGIPFAEELRAGCPMVLKFQSGPWSPETPFGGFWTLDIVDSTAFPGDSGKTAFTHRGSGPIALRKSQKSDNAFSNGGWSAETFGRNRIVISKKGVKDFFLVYQNGRMIREVTPLYEINIDYDRKSGLPRRIRSSGGAEVAAFNCDTFGLRPLLVAVRGAGIVSFKYGEFEFFTGPEKTERNFLLKEAVFGDRLRMKIEYYAEKREDVAVNGAILSRIRLPFVNFQILTNGMLQLEKSKKLAPTFSMLRKNFSRGRIRSFAAFPLIKGAKRLRIPPAHGSTIMKTI